jgi:transmembrane sensor
MLIGISIYFFISAAITTAIGEQRVITLADGTRIELNTQSRLQVRYDKEVRKVVLVSGEAYFEVAHEPRPFVVEAGPRKILALGTVFVVRRERASDGEMMVTLLEGRVAVAPVNVPNVLPNRPPSEVTVLSPGKRFRMRSAAAAVIDSPPLEQQTAWMRGQLIFENTPLREAVAEFNRYNAIPIRIATPAAGDIPVGGVFRTSDSVSFAVVVAQSHDLRLIRTADALVLQSGSHPEP